MAGLGYIAISAINGRRYIANSAMTCMYCRYIANSDMARRRYIDNSALWPDVSILLTVS